MKRFLALLLTLAMMLGSAALAEDKVVLTLGIYPEDVDTAAVDSHDNSYIPAMAELMPNVEIVKAHYKYATDTFVALAESGSIPTVFETWYTEPQKLIKGGFVKDITDELTELGWLEKMNPSVRALLSDENGRVYGTPRDGYALGLMINAEVFEDAGLVDEEGLPLFPKTWDELIETGKVIKEKTGSAALCLLAQDNAGGWHFSNIAWTFGAVLEAQDESGKWTAQLNTPEVLEAMQMVRRMVEEGILTSDPTSENWGTGFAQLGTGAAAMYIAANDAVNQPTAVNGLPVDKLMMVGIPAGSARSYSLSGGTPYMFAASATHEEVMAALKYLEIMGKVPIVTDASKAGLVADAEYRVGAGIPVIPDFPAWVDEAFSAAKAEVIAKYSNVDSRMFQHYFDAVSSEGNLKMEEPQMTQEMYAELTKVLQAVCTEENPDIQALLDTANANLQQILDEKVNQ